MKKRLEKYGVEMTDGGVQYHHEGRFFVCDGAYRILETKEAIPGLEIREDVPEVILRNIDMDSNPDLNYQLDNKLPGKEEIKEAIRNLAGRKRTIDVIWSNGKVTANARFLLKAIEALGSTVCGSAASGNRYSPIFLYEDDEPWQKTKILIMQIANPEGKTGFWMFDRNKK